MNKTELVNTVAEEAGITKKDAAAAIGAFTNVVTKALAEDDKVRLIGFGTFEVKTRAARTAFNPMTKEKISLEETKVPKLSFSSVVKEAVNAKKTEKGKKAKK